MLSAELALFLPFAPVPDPMAIAVDFGTSNTVVARWNAASEQPETISLQGLSVQLGDDPPLVPSLVYVERPHPSGILAGQSVRDRGLDITADPRFFLATLSGASEHLFRGFCRKLTAKP